MHFSIPVRVYYEDTDSGGVVYYANYLRYIERARTEWLRRLGFEQDVLRDEQGLIFAVRSVAIDYLKPARFNDELEITASLVGLGRASLELDQEVRRGDELLSRARVKVVCLDAQRFRPAAMPAALQRELDSWKQS